MIIIAALHKYLEYRLLKKSSIYTKELKVPQANKEKKHIVKLSESMELVRAQELGSFIITFT